MAYEEKIGRYILGLVDVLNKISITQIDEFLQTLKAARDEGRQIFVFGNGGSAATASHFAADLNKGLSYGKKKRLKVICLNDNVPTMMAYANDFGYEHVFVEPLKNFMNPGDVVIGISGSGNSKNVIRAIDYANEHGAITVGLCGYSGGLLKEKAKVVVHVNIDDMQKSEDVHLIVGHIAYQSIEAENE